MQTKDLFWKNIYARKQNILDNQYSSLNKKEYKHLQIGDRSRDDKA